MFDLKNKEELASLVSDLLKVLDDRKGNLFDMNKDITSDSDYWIRYDYEYAKTYLNSYLSGGDYARKDKLKPKGKVFLMLSYNEPFILSIIPVLNALIAGNEVYLRPALRNFDFVDTIWSNDLVDRYSLRLNKLSNVAHEEIEGYVKKVNSVYYFGGYETARKMMEMCARNFVEFNPEIEISDFKVVKMDEYGDFAKDAELSMHEAFTHGGQSCQRIQGIYVCEKNYKQYCRDITKKFNEICSSEKKLDYVIEGFRFNEKELKRFQGDLSLCSCEAKVDCGSKLPLIVFNPEQSSALVNSAYFLPSLWLIRYRDIDELLGMINSRFFRMGMNILSNDSEVVSRLVKETNFSRYTVNTGHTECGDEGWGGVWPSGFSGYRGWLETFSNRYVIIE